MHTHTHSRLAAGINGRRGKGETDGWQLFGTKAGWGGREVPGRPGCFWHLENRGNAFAAQTVLSCSKLSEEGSVGYSSSHFSFLYVTYTRVGQRGGLLPATSRGREESEEPGLGGREGGRYAKNRERHPPLVRGPFHDAAAAGRRDQIAERGKGPFSGVSKVSHSRSPCRVNQSERHFDV